MWGIVRGEIKKVRKASGEISVGCRQLGKMHMEPVARAQRRVRRKKRSSIIFGRARAEWVPAPSPVILRAVRLDSGVS